MNKKKIVIYFSILILLLSSCSEKKKEIKKELLIYCGITMIKPMTEIANIIEKQENCKIIITKGGSGNLLKSLVYNKVGDLYLPGSDRYHKIIEDKYKGLVTGTVFVGHNKAAIMVQKNNPKKISRDLENFIKKEYAVVICNPESGSIGKETKKILQNKGIYNEVLKNAMYLTTDSKDLVKALKTKEADLVINWYAVSTWKENKNFIDVIEINENFAKNKKLVLGLLKFSKHPEIAKKFMDYAASEKGKVIFKKHGLYF